MSPIDYYITDYPNPKTQLLLHELHQIILQSVPLVEQSIKWSLPFYSYLKPLCYMIPLKNGGINLGFMKGNLMSETYKILKSEGRKQIKVIEFQTVEDIFRDEVIMIIQEACLLNEQLYQKKG